MSKGKLFVISGASGVGKGTVLGKVMAAREDLKFSVSATTRDPRPGEVDGVSYHFVTDERFDELVAQDAFYEWAHVHQNRYGTLKSVGDRELAEGHDRILEIEIEHFDELGDKYGLGDFWAESTLFGPGGQEVFVTVAGNAPNAMQVLKSLLKEHLQATKPELDLEDILAGVK